MQTSIVYGINLTFPRVNLKKKQKKILCWKAKFLNFLLEESYCNMLLY
jgi:hypothetical protein